MYNKGVVGRAKPGHDADGMLIQITHGDRGSEAKLCRLKGTTLSVLAGLGPAIHAYSQAVCGTQRSEVE